MNTAVLAILIFGVLILVHELGHFIVAKATGIRVEEFAIGMGPKILGVKYGETDYSLRALPIGGYNKMSGMEPGTEDDEKGFNSKTVSQRMLVIVAGSLMNFLLAIVLFVLVFSFIGVPANSNVIGDTIAGFPAEQAGLKKGDQLTAINGEPVNNWLELTQIIQKNPEKNLTITVQRENTILQIDVTPKKDPETGLGLIGIRDSLKTYDVWTGLKLGTERAIAILVLIVTSLVHIVTGQAPAEVAGPVGIVQMIGEAAQYGAGMIFNFAALLSLNLGLINLLPIPALDGSRLVFLAIEGVRGKPINPERENFVHLIGFAMLILLMILITYKDILRIFN
ncbi:RIP metalloprotease RseP [Desulfitibacter alkalitolerans]|uniref:RIP metalloprotease RseP n=1 Tax=Desulfitibacter alkalitolerans TaxID=264641 RepID=UPI00047F56F4|nr:RIP metalloprotease RseP [Desulfitibacter alkalitolerans]